jgi:methionine-S-sulfoxide reductase
VGYAGGHTLNPTYRRIGDHTEAVEIDFDPSVISYADILSMIWDSHHPLKNFGGRQYRHAIWYQNEDQKLLAEVSREKVAENLGVSVDRIKTALEPAGTFTYAEDYHQKYLLRRQRSLIADLEALFPNALSFTDSSAMSRLNGWFGNGTGDSAQSFREEVLSFGLPPDLEVRVLAEI